VKSQKGFTLLELITTIIVIGILASIAIANYAPARENFLNKEAIANLKVLQSAQKAHKLDMNYYYASLSISAINQNLKTSLPSGTNKRWDYAVFSTGCSQATRTADDLRQWHLHIDDTSGEPKVGGCS